MADIINNDILLVWNANTRNVVVRIGNHGILMVEIINEGILMVWIINTRLLIVGSVMWIINERNVIVQIITKENPYCGDQP